MANQYKRYTAILTAAEFISLLEEKRVAFVSPYAVGIFHSFRKERISLKKTIAEAIVFFCQEVTKKMPVIN